MQNPDPWTAVSNGTIVFRYTVCLCLVAGFTAPVHTVMWRYDVWALYVPTVFLYFKTRVYTQSSNNLETFIAYYILFLRKKSFCIDLDKRCTTLQYFLMSLYKMTYHVVEDFITLLVAFKLISHYDLHNFVIFADSLHMSHEVIDQRDHTILFSSAWTSTLRRYNNKTWLELQYSKLRTN